MDDNNLIDQYEIGGERLRNAVRELTREDVLCVPAADLNVGRWSIQQVVVHVVDADLVLGDRMKRVIAEDAPLLIGYDETRFTERLHYDVHPTDESLALFDINRKHVARLLRRLAPADFARAGQHNERGRQTLADLLRYAVEHLDHHVKFIVAKREAFGKVMW